MDVADQPRAGPDGHPSREHAVGTDLNVVAEIDLTEIDDRQLMADG